MVYTQVVGGSNPSPPTIFSLKNTQKGTVWYRFGLSISSKWAIFSGNNLVNIDALRVIKWIGLEPSVSVPGRKKKVTIYGFHSLRHSFVSHCAEAGVPKAVVVSIIGANSEIIDKHYTHVGDEAQERAIMAISGESTLNTERDRIANALAIIDALPERNEAVRKIEAALRG